MRLKYHTGGFYGNRGGSPILITPGTFNMSVCEKAIESQLAWLYWFLKSELRPRIGYNPVGANYLPFINHDDTEPEQTALLSAEPTDNVSDDDDESSFSSVTVFKPCQTTK